jgi:hypothetical protein
MLFSKGKEKTNCKYMDEGKMQVGSARAPFLHKRN